MIMMMLMVTTMTTMIVVAGTVPTLRSISLTSLIPKRTHPHPSTSDAHPLSPPCRHRYTLVGSTLKKIPHCFRVISAVFSHSWVV